MCSGWSVEGLGFFHTPAGPRARPTNGGPESTAHPFSSHPGSVQHPESPGGHFGMGTTIAFPPPTPHHTCKQPPSDTLTPQGADPQCRGHPLGDGLGKDPPWPCRSSQAVPMGILRSRRWSIV